MTAKLSTSTEQIFRERIKKGTSLLDERTPGWEYRVDLDSIDMRSVDLCILGQVYGSYGDGLEKLGIQFTPHARYGFFLSWTSEDFDLIDYEELAALWATVIQERLDA